MKMLPTLGKDSSVTENGHFLVRPTEDGTYEVVDTVTDVVDSTTYDNGETVPVRYGNRESAEEWALNLAQQAIDNA